MRRRHPRRRAGRTDRSGALFAGRVRGLRRSRRVARRCAGRTASTSTKPSPPRCTATTARSSGRDEPDVGDPGAGSARVRWPRGRRRSRTSPEPVPAADEVVVAVRAVRAEPARPVAARGPAGARLRPAARRRDGRRRRGRRPWVRSGRRRRSGRSAAAVLVDPVSTCGRLRPVHTRARRRTASMLRTVGSTRPGGFAELVVVPAASCLRDPRRHVVRRGGDAAGGGDDRLARPVPGRAASRRRDGAGQRCRIRGLDRARCSSPVPPGRR